MNKDFISFMKDILFCCNMFYSNDNLKFYFNNNNNIVFYYYDDNNNTDYDSHIYP